MDFAYKLEACRGDRALAVADRPLLKSSNVSRVSPSGFRHVV